jgi:hypothetical protein
MLLLPSLLVLLPMQAAAELEYAAMRLVEEQQALLAAQPQPQSQQVRQQQLQLLPQQAGEAPAAGPARPAAGALPGAAAAGQALLAGGDEPQEPHGQEPPQQEVQQQAQEEQQAQQQQQQQQQQAQQPGQPLGYGEFVGRATQLLINCGEWGCLLPDAMQASCRPCHCCSSWHAVLRVGLSSLHVRVLTIAAVLTSECRL